MWPRLVVPKLFFSIHFIHHSFFACQLLGIKMNEINCCDSKPQSRDMIRENFYGAKIFESLNDQIDDGSGIETDYDFGIIGTPCQPFSRQRVKRSAEGSVKGHKSYSATFDDFVSWMTHFQPKAGCAEQVEGLDIPESTSDRRTPMERPDCSKRERLKGKAG